jgi:hypothetical protein
VLTPRETIRDLGHSQRWVARQMATHKADGMSETYLSQLIGGQRPWTPELRRLFALAVGIRQEAILFADDCTPAEQAPHDASAGTAQIAPTARSAAPDASNPAREPLCSCDATDAPTARVGEAMPA